MDTVTLSNVSKSFTIRHEQSRTLQETVLGFLLQRREAPEEFWALREVSFRAARGQTLGIIGQNGSGKSTILKLIAGTLRPTSGTVRTNGRVFALLELGAGFHPDLTGRENIFLNGSFLGLSRREMALHYDSILRFAELETFIDTPLKHYSSGMQMRLGFAIAAHVDPDIVVIDEVLAVGDASFRQKCFATLSDFKREGKTIIFVSHDAVAVRRFCDEALWIEAGRVREIGDPERVTRAYLAEAQAGRRNGGASTDRGSASTEDDAASPISLRLVETIDPSGKPTTHFFPGVPVTVRLSYEARVDCEDVTFAVGLHRPDGSALHTVTTRTQSLPLARTGGGLTVPAGEGEVLCNLGVLPLGPGEYAVSGGVWLGTDWRGAGERRFRATRFALEPRHAPGTTLLALAPRWLRLPDAPAAGHSRPVPSTGGDSRAGGNDEGGAINADEGRDEGVEGGRDGGAADDIPVCWQPPPTRVVMGEGEEPFLGHGWYPTEDWPPPVRWMGTSASLFLTQDDLVQSVGIAIVRPHHGPRPATGRVLVDDRVVGTFMLASPGLERFSYPVPAVAAPRPVEVKIEVDEPLVPADLDLGDDTRALGVAVQEVWFE